MAMGYLLEAGSSFSGVWVVEPVPPGKQRDSRGYFPARAPLCPRREAVARWRPPGSPLPIRTHFLCACSLSFVNSGSPLDAVLGRLRSHPSILGPFSFDQLLLGFGGLSSSLLCSRFSAPRPTMTTQAPHIVLLSFPGKGHINPFMFLARELSRRGLAVTLVVPSDVALAEIRAEDDDENIKLVALPNMFPSQDGKKRRITMEGIRRPLSRHRQRICHDEAFKKLLEDMMASSSPPVAVVIDLLLPSASAVVDELNIARYVLYTAATGHLALALYLNDVENEKDKLEAGQLVRVPGLPPLSWHEVASDIQDPTTDPFFVGPELQRLHLLESRGILLNTSYAIEGKVIDALREAYPRTNFMPVGPLGLDKPSPLRSELESKCQQWLDGQAERSVVFVSFGSWAALGGKQILELATGLESSNFSFLWLLPVNDEDGGLDSVLPEGFLTRTKERGLVLDDWAPQRLILSHPSLGAFVTHCGWNSVTECISLAGVPMLGWPFIADQPVICKYLVEELGVAVGILEDEDGTASAAEVERALQQVMGDPEVRQRAGRLKQRVRDELANEQRNLEDLVLCLKQSWA